MRHRILLTGASGLLGGALIEAWSGRHDLRPVSGTRPVRYAGARAFDLRDRSELSATLNEFAPTHIVHAAALTDVDYCEAHAEEATHVNAVVSADLANAARAAGASFTYLSTEAVFDGQRGGYGEDDQPEPINRYAASKLDGEARVRAADPAALILRIGLEGWRPAGRPGFVQWIVDGLRRGERRNVCTDWAHSIVFAANLPAIIEACWTDRVSGVVHVTDGQRTSNFDLAIRTAGIFDLDDALLTPIPSSRLELRARRPLDVSLTTVRLPLSIRAMVWNLDTGLRQMRRAEGDGELARMRTRLAA